MMRTVTAFAALLLAGCSTIDGQARQAVLASLPDPYGVTFEGLQTYPGDVLCGSFEATDLTGFQRQQQRFVYADGVLYRRPQQRQWDLFCTATPATALFEATGIGPWGPDNTALEQIRGDFNSLEAAIQAYREDHGGVPLGTDLGILAAPPEPYLEDLPRDPWGRPYEYSVGLGGRGNREYSLRTLGADGEVGGSGAAADVDSALLPYLNRLARS